MAKFDYAAVVSTPVYSKIDMSFESIATLQMGLAYPLLHKEIIPGDSWDINLDHIMRLAPLQAPIYDDVEFHVRAFFTPNRILDPKWKEYITGGVGLYGNAQEELPCLSFTTRSLVSSPSSKDEVGVDINDSSGGGVGSLADFLNFHFYQYDDDGHPMDHYSNLRLNYLNTPAHKFDIKPFLGYWKIYDDWYRNERVQAEKLPNFFEYIVQNSTRVLDVDWSDAQNANLLGNYYWSPFQMFRVNYAKDRYTTALPEPQVGSPVMIPTGTDTSSADVPAGYDGVVYAGENKLGVSPDVSTNVGKLVGTRGSSLSINTDSGQTGLYVDLVNAAQATIAQLKMAFKTYDFFMKDTYNGNRYVEFMDAHYDVKVPDATVDRAIYLGQEKVRISFGEVFQTSNGDGTSASGVLGDYAGRGASYSENSRLVDEKFLEHGQLYIIGSIVPRAKYFQGVDRKFFKESRFDYFFPEFQDIGDDVLYLYELSYELKALSETTHDSPDDPTTRIFGFNARWSHYKESLDEVHGDFLTNMDYYHFGRRLDTPSISQTFSAVQTINDPFSVTADFSENYLVNLRWNAYSARPVKLYESF